MSEHTAPAHSAEGIGLAVGFFARGVISPAVLWDELTAALTPAAVESALGSLAAEQQATLREVFKRWPRALRSEVRDNEVRRAVERWCQAALAREVQPEPEPQPAVDLPTWTAPRPQSVGAPPSPDVDTAPQDGLSVLRTCYREYGYVRRPRALYSLRADDGAWEVRFVVRYKYELTRFQQVLQGVGFTPGNPSRKRGYHLLSVSGRTATERLLALVGRRW
jgi:hypothetical protein